MRWIKKILIFIKDFLIGALYPCLAVGFMLLVASAMLYFRPQDYFTGKHPVSPADHALALHFFFLGGKVTLASAAALGLALKIQSWFRSYAAKKVASGKSKPKDVA